MSWYVPVLLAICAVCTLLTQWNNRREHYYRKQVVDLLWERVERLEMERDYR